jgi:hypothetical protein
VQVEEDIKDETRPDTKPSPPAVTFPKIKNYMDRNFGWMRGSVRKSFEMEMNISTITQICCLTEALSRFWAGTVKECPGDRHKEFCGFMRKYFRGFNAAAQPIGTFFINSDRCKRGGLPREVDAFEAFYYLYRHGLVHEYLQKAGSFITRKSDDGDLPYLRVRANPRGILDPCGHKTRRLHVHLDPLVEDFGEAVDEYRKDLLLRAGRRKLQTLCRQRYTFILR